MQLTITIADRAIYQDPVIELTVQRRENGGGGLRGLAQATLDRDDALLAVRSLRDLLESKLLDDQAEAIGANLNEMADQVYLLAESLLDQRLDDIAGLRDAAQVNAPR